MRIIAIAFAALLFTMVSGVVYGQQSTTQVSANFFINCMNFSAGVPDWTVNLTRKSDGQKVVYNAQTQASCQNTICPGIDLEKCEGKQDGGACDRKEWAKCGEKYSDFDWMTSDIKGWALSNLCNEKTHYWTDGVKSYGHVGSLKNKPSNPFIPNKQVGIYREIYNDNGTSAGQTVWATLKDTTTAVADAAMLQQMTNIKKSTSPEHFILPKMTTQPVADAQGNLTISHAETVTTRSITHRFFGIQSLFGQTPTPGPADDGIEGPLETDQSGLKLGTFGVNAVTPTATPTPPPEGAQNCATIHWDPYGRVVDVTTLLPVSDTVVGLESQAGTWVKAQTINNNPAISNQNGMYYLIPSAEASARDMTYRFTLSPPTPYRFPVSADALNRAVEALAQIDPSQMYVRRDKLYTTPGQTFVEKANTAEEQYIFVQPSSPAPLPTSVTPFAYVIGTSTAGNQIIGGSTWPKATVVAQAGETSVSTIANMAGEYELEFPSTGLQSGQMINVTARPIMITPSGIPLLTTLDINPFSALTKLMRSPVYAATVGAAAQVAPIPVSIGGFAYGDKFTTTPHATVEFVIPSLGGIVYSTAKADEYGFIAVDKQYIPNMNFEIRIKDGSKSVAQYEASEFVALNKRYHAQTQSSAYNPTLPPMPEPALIAQAQAAEVSPNERLALSEKSRTRLAAAPQGAVGVSNVPEKKNSVPSAVFFTLIIMLVGIPLLGAVWYMRKKRIQ